MNLVKTSLLFRRVVNVVIAILLIYIIAKALTPTINNIISTLNPPKDPPTIKYGQLDPLEFIEKPISGEVGEFVLDTSSGKLPSNIPSKLPVYPYRQPTFSYVAGQKAQEHARTLGFDETELTSDLKSDVFTWVDRDTNAFLRIDSRTEELLMVNSLENFSSLPTGRLEPTLVEVSARNLLNSVGRLYDPQFNREKGVVTLAAYENDNFKPVTRNSEAQIARIDFFRKVLDYPIVNENPKKGTISMYMTGINSEKNPTKFPIIDYHEWEIINDESGTYPLISIQEAWDAVANKNKGVIVSIIPQSKSPLASHEVTSVQKVFVNNVYIGYYDTAAAQTYMQPVYVFEGKYNVRNRAGGEIVIYFPALQGQYIKTPVVEEVSEE